MFGWGVYLLEQSISGAITSDNDPIGITAEEIERRNVLFHRMDFLAAKEAPNTVQVRYEIDTRVRRVIKGSHLLAILVKGDVSLGWQYAHSVRCLIREGTL